MTVILGWGLTEDQWQVVALASTFSTGRVTDSYENRHASAVVTPPFPFQQSYLYSLDLKS